MKPPLMNGRSDNFQTPKIGFDYLLPYIKKEWKIWECAWGEGELLNHMKNAGFTAFGSDKEYDFLKEPAKECDCIITNPPYSLKDEFIERCYEHGKPFALLMPLTALEGQKRQALFKKNGISLLIPPKRINFKTPSGTGSGSWFMTAWFCWKLPIPNQLTFIEAALRGE